MQKSYNGESSSMELDLHEGESNEKMTNSRKVSVIVKIEKSNSSTPYPSFETQQNISKCSSVQFCVLSGNVPEKRMYSSLSQLEKSPSLSSNATELTLFNSSVPSQFATLAKDRSGRCRRDIRHSKTFADFNPVPLPEIPVRGQKLQHRSVQNLKRQIQDRPI